MKSFIRLIALIVAIPIAGWFAGNYVEGKLQDQWQFAIVSKYGAKGTEAIASGKISFQQLCTSAQASRVPACETHTYDLLMQKASIAALGAGLGLVLIIFLLARVASVNRSLLLYVFSPAIKVVLLVLFCLILAQGAIAAYGLYAFESAFSGSVHLILIGVILLTTLLGSIFMISEGMSISKRVTKTVLGKVITPATQPELWRLVNNLATRIGARPPDNIIIGLEPNFYVTSADVTPYPATESEKGETLFISLPLMRILSFQELAAVIGHELAHFCGDDTKFSLKFYPIYAGTSQALEALQLTGGQQAHRAIALLPATAILSFFMAQFGAAEKTISRVREFAADKLGASIASARHLSTAMLKIGAYGPLWESTWRTIAAGKADPAQKEKIYTNMSSLYAEIAASSDRQAHWDEIVSSAITHPTDTHPQTGARIEALGLSVHELKEQALALDAATASARIVANLADIEQELTKTEHVWRGTAPRK